MIYLVRYAEIALKGSNRTEFEEKLVANIKASLKAANLKAQVKRTSGRLILRSEQEIDLRRVFGIASYSQCHKAKAELQPICSKALELAEQHMKAEKTPAFRISSRRLTKDLFLSSLELNNKIGAFIAEKTGLKVDLDNPRLDIGIEIIGSEAFLFTKTTSCFGGLPVGIEGKLLALISDFNSVFAALLMMRRGCAVELAGLAGTIPEQHLALLQSYSPDKLSFHSINDASRLFEMARSLECKAAVVGESLESLESHPNNILILRPLIAFSEHEISSGLEKFMQA